MERGCQMKAHYAASPKAMFCKDDSGRRSTIQRIRFAWSDPQGE